MSLEEREFKRLMTLVETWLLIGQRRETTEPGREGYHRQTDNLSDCLRSYRQTSHIFPSFPRIGLF